MKTKPDHKDKINMPLEGLPGELKENPFEVPDGYFEQFYDTLEGRIQDEERSHKFIILKTARSRWIAAAALAIILITTSIFLVNRQKGSSNESIPSFTLTLADLDESFGWSDFDEFTVVSYYIENSNGNGPSFQAPTESNPDTVVTNKDIEQYLLQGNEIENLILNL